MITKPTIFFSHSAHDAELLTALKQEFCKRTAFSIDIFLSSDGSSIPFGHNWQKVVEDALNRSNLMFVFLSPLSVNSKWIYFESGFAYAKNLKVVPIALEGVELGKQPPPLQLLNGFNVNGHEGLNNMIHIANESCGHSHQLSFSPNDYLGLISKAKLGPARTLGRHAGLVERIRITVRCSEPQDQQAWLAAYANMPNAGQVMGKRGRTTLGLEISVWDSTVNFEIDRVGVDRVYPVVEALLATLRPPPSPYGVEVWFDPVVQFRAGALRRSAGLIGTDWEPGYGGYARSENGTNVLSFTLNWHEAEHPEDDEAVWVKVTRSERLSSLADLKEVIDLCFDRELLSPSQGLR